MLHKKETDVDCTSLNQLAELAMWPPSSSDLYEEESRQIQETRG